MKSIKDASKEELIENIESLKEENTKVKDELMQKVRHLESEQLKSNVSNRKLEGKIKERHWNNSCNKPSRHTGRCSVKAR